MIRNSYHWEKFKQKTLPVLQGHLIEDSVTELCSTGKHKTTLTVKTLKSGKEYPCVFWQYCSPLKKGELVIARGYKMKDVFVCISLTKTNVPYEFG